MIMNAQNLIQKLEIPDLSFFNVICRYLEPLAIALDKEKWSLVQLLLSSSYSGYGTSSLQQVTYLILFNVNDVRSIGFLIVWFYFLHYDLL
jgi:hypothetical protein